MDTTSSMICSAMFELKRNPEFLTRVRAEVKEKVLKGANTCDVNMNDVITAEALDECEQLSYLAKETLRKHPAAPFTLGYSTQEKVNLKCGITIPKGQNIIMPVVAIHNHPRIYREPEKFVPDRFNPESEWYLTPEGKP